MNGGLWAALSQMQVSNISRVSQIVAASAAALRDLCIRRTGMITVRSTSLSRATVHRVPLILDVEIEGVELSGLPSALYAEPEPVGIADVEAVFEAFLRQRKGHDAHAAGLRALLRRTAPSLPFTTPRGSTVTVELAQLLYSLSWYGHKVAVRSSSVSCMGFAVESSALEVPGRRLLVRRTPGATLPKILRLPLGPVLNTGPRVGALRAYLLETLPDFQPQVEAVVSAAVQAGEDVQKALCSAFDVNHEALSSPGDLERVNRVSTLLRRAGSKFPYEVVRDLLEPVVGTWEFCRFFGLDEHWRRRKYSDVTLASHLKYLEELRGEAIADAQETEGSDDDLAAFQLAQLIR